MKKINVYYRCEKILLDCQTLFNYYERYRNCASISYMDNDMNNILRKIGLAYSGLMTKVCREVKGRSVVNRLVIIQADNYIETIGDNNALFMKQIISLLRLYKGNIIAMLEDATEPVKTIYLNNFESALTDAQRLINRMELMIRNSQKIGSQYLRATA